MTGKIPDAQLSRLNQLVARYFGVHFPPERWPDLERGVRAAAEECSHHGVEPYLHALLSSASTQKRMEILVNHLTIGETYFFREKRALEILEGRIVPELVRTRSCSRKQLKVWSAGCATGEEPYSIAMVLSKLMPDLKDWSIELLATDVNTRSLQKASEGIYTDWSFRGTPAWVRCAYFEATEDGRWTIAPAIKEMVSFAPVNLMDDAYPPFSSCPNGLDVIFCRNVLMYFTPEGMRKVIRRFYQYLAADGWLIVSPTETSHELFSDFATVSFGDATLYRKSDQRLPATLALPVDYDYRSSVQQPPRIVEPAIVKPTIVEPAIVEPARPLETSICHPRLAAQGMDSVQVSEEMPAASYEKALGLYEQGHYEEAGRMTGALLLGNGSDARALLLLARIHANQGKLAEALGWCDKAIAADKMAARAYYLRATILQEQSSIPEAILAFKQAVYAEPQFVLGHFALGNLALKHGRLKESRKHFDNVLLLLARHEPECLVPESEGLSAGRLREMIVTPSTRAELQTESASRAFVRRTSSANQGPQTQVGKLELSRR
jgi:chemotaxis protein methyltransferase CheR